MPRANRYMLQGEVYHLTHRCHNKDFLLRFACDRSEYCRRLFKAVREFDISLFSYSVTKNHTHLLATAARIQDISDFIHKLDGGFAAYYNARKESRTNSFWGDRFHATMIESGEHLLNCIAYIDLNMVRAGVVAHPGKWAWCGYSELMGRRSRKLVLDLDRLVNVLGIGTVGGLRSEIERRIGSAIRQRDLTRQRCWTEGVAVGSETYVKRIAAAVHRRNHQDPVLERAGAWVVYEPRAPYSPKTAPKSRNKAGFQCRFGRKLLRISHFLRSVPNPGGI